jgi:hypothetical protein
MEPLLKITTVKSSVAGIGWKAQYIPPLKALVANVHIIVTHTFAFLKYIFIQKLDEDPDFFLEDFINVDFYREVFLSLLKSYNPDKQKRTARSRGYKELINKHRNTYFQHCSYEPIELKYAQQIANYEVVKIKTAYLNGVACHFGNKLRMFLNMVLKKKERIAALKDEMKRKTDSANDISAAVKTLTNQCTRVKIAISSRNMDTLPKDFLSSSDIDMIQDFFSSYNPGYQFAKGSIYYDCKANPAKHLKAYYRLAYFCEVHHGKSFNCFPLRRTFIPLYITIDTYILNTQILKNSIISHLDKEVLWGGVIEMKSKPMKPQGENKRMAFKGMIYTDGVGVSVLKQNHDTKKKGGGGGGKQKAILAEEKEFKYVEKLEKEELLADVGKCVLIDPGRRDMLYCMHEESTPQEKKTYRYTSNQRAIETKSRKFKKLRESMKPDAVAAAELSLSHFKSSTVNKDKFVEYLKQKTQVTQVLKNYYSNEDLTAERQTTDLPPFRKMKLSSFINRQQSDKRLAKNIRNKFGDDTVIVIGVRRMFSKEGFKVYLLDEFKTSSLCPSCENGELETFKVVQNPRPFRREKHPTVERHGLLRYFYT